MMGEEEEAAREGASEGGKNV